MEGRLVAQRHVDEAVVGQGAHGGDGGALLAAAEGAGGDEETSVLAPETARGPLTAYIAVRCEMIGAWFVRDSPVLSQKVFH